MKKILQAVLVDDEEYCRQDLSELLSKMSEVRIVGEASSAKEARQVINAKRPDVVFLDMNLTDGDGFRVLTEVERIPAVVAVTAFSQHAAKGFSMDLADYILKPVEEKRLALAVRRARDHILLRSLRENPGIQIDINGLSTPLTISDIFWAKASENYVEVCSTAGKGLVRSTFHNFKNSLPAGFTLEISRGLIVARHQIKQWRRGAKGHLEIILKCNGVLKVAKRMQREVLQQLELLGY